MKNLSIKIIGISFGLLLMWVQVYPQGQIKSELAATKGSVSSEQSWSMELRAKRAYTTQSTINYCYLVNPSDVLCNFAIAYDHGQNFDENARRTYMFTYSILRGGVVINSITVDVAGSGINDYVAYYQFPGLIQVYSNDIISGMLNISYRELQQGGGYTFGNILPDQLAPNSIILKINPYNVITYTVVQPVCPDIAPPNYYHLIEATNSITLNPGFMVDAADMDFYAEAINRSGGTKNIENMPDMTEEIVLKTGNEQNADEVFIRLYPNPSDGRFTVKNIRTEEITISFYGQMGKLIPDEKLNAGEEKEVNLSQINARFITLLVYSNGKIVSRNTMIINK